MKQIAAVALAIIAALSWTFALRLGVFKTVEIQVKEDGPFKMIYKHHVGAYHKIVPVIEEVEKWAQANGEKCQYSFGEYLDDPTTTDEDRRNANGGCIVDHDYVTAKLPEGFVYREMPKHLYVVAHFEGAPSIGPFKVYPKAESTIAEQGLVADGATIEVYEKLPEEHVTTMYHFPVRRR